MLASQWSHVSHVSVRTSLRSASGAAAKQPSKSSKSSPSTPTTPPLLTKTYEELLHEQVKAYPHKHLFVSVNEDRKWSYAESDRHFNALAYGLAESGGKAPFATALPLNSENFVSQAAAARLNSPWTVLPLNSLAPQLEAQLKHVNPGTLIWPAKVHKNVQLDEIYDLFPYFLDGPLAHKHIPLTDARFPNLRHVVQTSKQDLDGMYRLPDLLTYNDPNSIKNNANNYPRDAHIVTIVDEELNSVKLSHQAILNVGSFVGSSAGVTEEDRICTTIGPYDASGMALGLGLTLAHKATLVWGAEMFDASKTMEAAISFHCTVIVARAHELADLRNAGEWPKELKKVIAVASPSSPVDFAEVAAIEALGVNVTIAYGVNETTGIFAVTDAKSAKGSVGKALPHSSVSDKGGKLVVEGFNVSGSCQGQKYQSKISGSVSASGDVFVKVEE
eukprot:TRINITY_DN948_c0_g2_i1.p1 TRINITY_DN948_c0_g2~~TRINITY_DN948_c0_g2_i1.p1  ORF type:complete len:446 (-),score=117.78 TRINITY_DN948_c0_g2_i1:51-1388(-)